jgi:hypothetical protein
VWRIVYATQKNHFNQQESTIAVAGDEAGAEGIMINPQRQAFSIGNLLFVPVCIDKDAAAGQWQIIIKTDVADSSLEETIVAAFQVR